MTTATGWELAVASDRGASLQVPDGPLITLPAGSVDQAGTLRVAPLANDDVAAVSPVARGWRIELVDARLSGVAQLTFELGGEGEHEPIVGYEASDGRLLPVEGHRQGNAYVVPTEHFSNWFLFSWGDVLSWARSGMDRLYAAAAEGKQPKCQGEEAVRDSGVKVTSDDGARILWCVGREGDGLARLKVTNARGYAVTAEYTPGLTLVGKPSLLGWMPSLGELLGRPSRKGNQVTLIGPGETIQFDVDDSQSEAGVLAQPSVPGFLASALRFGVDTLMLVNPLTGGKVDNLQKSAEVALCVKDFAENRVTVPENAWEAQAYLVDSLGIAFDCLGDQLAEQVGGWFAGAVISGVAWLWSGVQLALNGFGAAVDTLLNPSGYQILIKFGGGAKTVPIPTAAAVIASGSCGPNGEITGHTFFSHPTWGASVLVTCLDLENRELQGLAVADHAGAIRWSYPIHGNYYELLPASPGVDASGNLFILYEPGRYWSVAVFRPVAGSLSRLAGFYPYDESEDGRFYYSELVGPDAAGYYTIDDLGNDCEPDCALGTITSELYTWDGRDYVRR